MLTICFRKLLSAPSLYAGLILLSLSLSACGSVKSEAKYPAPQDSAEAKKYGTIEQIGDKEDDSGFTLFDSGHKRGAGQSSIGVNGYLWHAALDTINFMPIASADSNGGTILTDWYSPPSTPNERIKLNIVIKDQTLRADGVQVRVFKQTLDSSHVWRDADVAKDTGTQLEDTIVARARQLRLQTEGKKKEAE